MLGRAVVAFSDSCVFYNRSTNLCVEVFRLSFRLNDLTHALPERIWTLCNLFVVLHAITAYSVNLNVWGFDKAFSAQNFVDVLHLLHGDNRTLVCLFDRCELQVVGRHFLDLLGALGFEFV